MSTRGVVGFRKDGIDKIKFNRYDSYPRELGYDVQRFLKNTSIEVIRGIVDRIEVVDENGSPTPEQVEVIKKYGIDIIPGCNWFFVMATVNLDDYLNGFPYLADSSSFLKDSLFCEWGYVINLDTEMLEIYRGFQNSPSYNRYFTDYPYDNEGKYFNCQMIKEISFDELQSFDMGKFENEIDVSESRAEWFKRALRAFDESVKVFPSNKYQVMSFMQSFEVERPEQYQYKVKIQVEVRAVNRFDENKLEFEEKELKNLREKLKETIQASIFAGDITVRFGKYHREAEHHGGWMIVLPVDIYLKQKKGVW